MTAVENDRDVRAPPGDLADELGELFVGQAPRAQHSAVVAHEGLIEMVWLDFPKLFGCTLLRAVPAEIEKAQRLPAWRGGNGIVRPRSRPRAWPAGS